MSIKNAPTKWNEISEAAKACGAGEWAMRKWLERCEIPAAWKLRIFEHSKGSLSFEDMSITEAESIAGVSLEALASAVAKSSEEVQ